jgi:hypothetical protein
MDTNFLLQLTGLCGLVPNDQGGMRFVLLNAKSMNPPHVAAILVREGSSTRRRRRESLTEPPSRATLRTSAVHECSPSICRART